jgi:hypothetical protein
MTLTNAEPRSGSPWTDGTVPSGARSSTAPPARPAPCLYLPSW